MGGAIGAQNHVLALSELDSTLGGSGRAANSRSDLQSARTLLRSAEVRATEVCWLRLHQRYTSVRQTHARWICHPRKKHSLRVTTAACSTAARLKCHERPA